MERKRLEQKKGQIQQGIKTSINTIERKISKYNTQIKLLKEQKLRLIHEYNKEVPHEHRMRGSTPEDVQQKKDSKLKELTDMCKTMHQINEINQLNNMGGYNRKNYESSKSSDVCNIL